MLNKFTASQKRGALILLAVLIGIAGWRWRLAELEKNKPLPDESTSSDQYEKGERDGARYGGYSSGNPNANKDFEGPAQPAVYVELNSADTSELKTVRGIGSVFANRIVKYRKLIGGFERKEDLLKVYGIDEERYAGIAPQVWVDETSEAYPVRKEGSDKHFNGSPNGEQYSNREQEDAGDRDGGRKGGDSLGRYPDADAFKASKKDGAGWGASEKGGLSDPRDTPQSKPDVNLNTADSLTLIGVKGIGAKTASNILKYRKLIFFFHSLDQLSEVWGVREKNLEIILPQVFIGDDLSTLPHLKVNEMDVQQLASHYYLDYKKARLIVAYREQHGAYGSLADLQKIRGIETGEWAQLLPYLEF